MATNYTPGVPASLFCSKCGAAVSNTDAFCPNCAAPQLAQPVVPQTGSQPSARTYAGFWIRFAAMFIDRVLIGIVMSPVSIMTGMFLGTMPRIDRSEVALGALFSVVGLAILLGLVASWLYEALMTSSSKQATVGKMVFGLVVTDTQGRRISFAHATGRFFAKFLSGPLTLMIGFIMAGFTERKQALHDFVAGTYVLKGRPTAL